MAIMDSMNKKRQQELKSLFGDSQQSYQFLIQMMDNSGQIGEKCFGIKCIAEKEKKQEGYPAIAIYTQLNPPQKAFQWCF